MTLVPGKIALLRQLLCDGISVMFGNPGTVEQNLLDALTDVPEIEYVMGLQESVVLAMADGYARATHRPAVAQIHAAVGLGNAVAMLYQAHRSFTPLVVIAGETRTDLQAFDGFLGGDIVRIAQPVTKWAAEVSQGRHILRMLRRALKVAATPPQGPVFLAIPMDVLDEPVEDDIRPTSFVDWHVAPSREAIAELSAGILASEEPLMLIGDGVALASAQAEVRALSEFLGCPVYGVDFADLSAAFPDPMFQGLIGHSYGESTRAITAQADAVIAVGTPLFPELFPSPNPYFREGAKLYQIDLNTWELGKNYPAAACIAADPKPTLIAVLNELEARAPGSFRTRAAERKRHWIRRKSDARRAVQNRFAAEKDRLPLPPSRVMEIVAASLPKNAIVFDEAITCSDELLHFLQPAQADAYLLGRGGCIGVGWPGAIGVKFAHRDRPVLAISGDGSCLFVIQALWTAAHYNLHIVFLVCNNRSYRILKVNLLRYWRDHGSTPREFPHFDLTNPEVRYDRIAEGFGVRGRRAEDASALESALAEAFSLPGPHLIDVATDGSVSEEMAAIIRCHSGCS